MVPPFHTRPQGLCEFPIHVTAGDGELVATAFTVCGSAYTPLPTHLVGCEIACDSSLTCETGRAAGTPIILFACARYFYAVCFVERLYAMFCVFGHDFTGD